MERYWNRRRRGDDGAVLPIVALSLTVLLVMSAFVVDLGRLMIKRRDLQGAADVVALDLARLLDGRTTGAIQADPTWANTKATSAAANGYSDPSIFTASLGQQAGRGQPFTATSSNQVPTAVKVVATDTVRYFFATIIGLSSASTSRTGYARQEATACWSLGSYAANVSSGQQQSLLNALLNDALNTSAVSYTGLANASVTYDDLAAQLGVGGPENVLNGSFSYAEVAGATAAALSANGDTANASTANGVAQNVPGNQTVPFNDFVNASQGNGSALSGSVNVLDLLAADAFLANGSNALSLPTGSISIPGLTSITGTAAVTQAPVTTCSPAGGTNSQSQVSLDITATVAIPLVGSVVYHLTLGVANGTSVLTAVACRAGSPLTQTVGITSSVLTPALTVSIAGVSQAIVSPPTTTNSSSSSATFNVPPDVYGTSKVSTGSSSVSFATLFGGASVSGQPVLNATLANLLDQLNTYVSPLFQLMGMRVAGSDAYLQAAIKCDNVNLSG